MFSWFTKVLLSTSDAGTRTNLNVTFLPVFKVNTWLLPVSVISAIDAWVFNCLPMVFLFSFDITYLR
ncbi:hypothetical protein KPLM21_1080002 [Klebsiella pneumoniae]|nr:hypothetical protein KPLM21_1080002 [Klebsiella pneumoniae]